MTRMGTTAQVNDWCKRLKVEGCKVMRDRQAGIVKIIHEGVEILWGMKKGASNVWILRFKSNAHFQWQDR